MKNRSWGCSVTRTCLKNTVTDPVVVQERSPNAKPASSKGTTWQAEAMATPTTDKSVTNKEGVDALNTYILRKLAKESFMSEGGSKKVGYSGESHFNKKANTWETPREGRGATIPCKYGSHMGEELFSSFSNLHNNTMYLDTTKSNPACFDGGKVSDGVDLLMSRIGLDNKKMTEPKPPVFQNSSRFDKVPQPRTLVSTKDFLKPIPSKDAGESQSSVIHNSMRAFLSVSTEQGSNFKRSADTVGHMWCIPEVNSKGDVMCTEFSPSHRFSTTGHEKAAALKSNPACPLTTHDELAPFENSLLKQHVNSPVHKEDALEEVIKETSLQNALSKGMQLWIDDATRDLQNSRSKQHTDSPLEGTELIRKIIRDGVGETVSSKTPWPKQPKTAAHVRRNLRELMQREEIEEDVDANLNALRTAYTPKQGSEELCCQPKSTSVISKRKESDTKEEDSVGGCGAPRRLELGIAKLKIEEAELNGVALEDTKVESNTFPRDHLIGVSTIQGVQVQISPCSDCQSRSAACQMPFVVPSSSKSQTFQQFTGSPSNRKSKPFVRNWCDQSEYGVAGSPSRNSEEARKRSKHSNTKVLHGSPIGDAMPLRSAKNLESRSYASNAPAMIPWNYQGEKQLPIGRNIQLASPNRRSTPKSPSSPEHRRQCRDSPVRKPSPKNTPSPLSSPLRQQKPRPALTTLISTTAQVRSPKPDKTLSKEQADHMSTTVITKPSHDLDNLPPGISEAVVQESIALAKDSSDPYADFRDSMLEMMQEKNLWQRGEELQDLLQCFLHLNQPVHHQLIHQAFSDVVSFGSPLSYSHKSSKLERSNAHFNHRSSTPSRQLYALSSEANL